MRRLGDDQHDDLVDYADECSIPGHLDLVDEAALDIFSHNRVRRARAKITAYVLGILGVIALAIGSGIIFAQRYRSSSDFGVTFSLSSGDSANSTVNLTSHKAYINKLCSSLAISSLKGKLRCTDVCADSSCCRTVNTEENCMSDFPAVCLEFEACNILSDSNTTINVSNNKSMIIEASEQPVTMSPVNLNELGVMNNGSSVSTILDVSPIDSGIISTNNSNEIDIISSMHGGNITGDINASTGAVMVMPVNDVSGNNTLNGDATEPYKFESSNLEQSLNVTPSVTVMGAKVSVDGIVYDKDWIRSRVNDTCISVESTVQENLSACKQLCELANCCYREERSCIEEAEFCEIFSKCKDLLLT